MNTVLKTVLIALVVLAVAGGLFLAGQAYGRWQSPTTSGYWGMPMMGGRGWNNNGYGPMMGGRDGGGNNRYGYGPMMGPMMGGYGYGPGYTEGLQPLTIDEARQAAESYLKDLRLDGLEIREVMVFDNNAYVVVEETGTNLGAFELLVDPVTKLAYPEFGPNMMWNLKYGGINHGGMMGGRGMGWMMGGYGQNWIATPADVISDMPVVEDQAIQAAQAYLDDYLPGHTVADDPIKFYGYYTLDFEKDGKVVGMLSVNGYNGDVFVHSWHGTFIEEAE